MKKIYKTLLLFIFLFVIGNVSFGQPANVHYGVMGIWGDAALSDRGMTMAGSVQSPLASTISFLFNTAVGVYNPKWCGSTTNFARSLNQKIAGGAYYYTTGGWDVDMTCTVLANYYYTLIVGKNTAANNDMSILETSYNPVTITTVTQSPAANITPSTPVTVTVTLGGAKNASEKVFIRYTTDSWATSNFLEITSFNASFQGSVIIPGQIAGTIVSYYALTTNLATAADHATIDYFTLRLNNNTNLNYTYTVTPSVGIEETNTATMDVYPNPATSLLTVRIKSTGGDVMLKLYSMLGDAVMTDVLNGSGIIQKNYDVSDLPKGTYILNININNSFFTKKVVIY